MEGWTPFLPYIFRRSLLEPHSPSPELILLSYRLNIRCFMDKECMLSATAIIRQTCE
jgi:hypothetical protein